MPERKLAVLGLDAMPLQYFNKLMNSGIMPYTRQIVWKSITLELEAYPPVTPPSWSSIMTGVNPGKHGIFGFFHYRKPDLNQRLYTSTDLKHPRIHEMLSIIGKKSIVFNPIPDYPIIPARNAVVISNLFFTPKPLSHPADAYKKYFGSDNPLEYTKDGSCGILDSYIKVIDLYLYAIEKAVNEEDHTLLWINLNAPDILFHRCPSILEDKVVNGEQKIFSGIDRIIRLLDENYDSLIIVSDHGFSRYSGIVGVNDILVRHGFAKASSKEGLDDITSYRIREGLVQVDNRGQVKISPRLYALLKKTRLNKIARRMLRVYQRVTGKKMIVSTSKKVDPVESGALLPDHYAFGIYARDPRVIPRVREVLEEYSDYLTVLDPREFYSGPYVEDGQDIVLFPRFDKGYWIASNLIGAPILHGDYYAHHPHGVFILRASEFDNNTCSSGQSVPNHVVAQVALHLMKVPLPSDRDDAGCFEKELKDDAVYNYTGKWNLMMRLMRVKNEMKQTSNP